MWICPGSRACIPALSIAALVHAGSLHAQAIIQGRVIDDRAGTPIAGAGINIRDAFLGAVSGADGRFTIQGVAPGTALIEVEMPGYATRVDTATVRAGETTEVTIRLFSASDARPSRTGGQDWLDSQGFHARGAAGTAVLHRTRAQLAREGRVRITDVLRRESRVQVRRLAERGEAIRLVPPGGGAACDVAVYVNGAPVEFGRFDWHGVRDATASRPIRLDDMMSLEDVDGLELYDATEAPVATTACGALLVWSQALRRSIDEPLVGSVRGRAVDATTGLPIAAARIVLQPGSLIAKTDESGRFELRNVSPGDHVLNAEVAGAAPWSMRLTVKAFAVVEVDLRLESRSRPAAANR